MIIIAVFISLVFLSVWYLGCWTHCTHSSNCFYYRGDSNHPRRCPGFGRRSGEGEFSYPR